MGTLINPGNAGFTSIRASRYVDKNGLVVEVNHTIDTTEKLTCIGQPRRFGK